MSTRSERAARHPNNRSCPAGTPDCPYAPQPHFVSPSMGQVGFFLCAPPADIRNHTRCHPPYDHESPEHNW